MKWRSVPEDIRKIILEWVKLQAPMFVSHREFFFQNDANMLTDRALHDLREGNCFFSEAQQEQLQEKRKNKHDNFSTHATTLSDQDSGKNTDTEDARNARERDENSTPSSTTTLQQALSSPSLLKALAQQYYSYLRGKFEKLSSDPITRPKAAAYRIRADLVDHQLLSCCDYEI